MAEGKLWISVVPEPRMENYEKRNYHSITIFTSSWSWFGTVELCVVLFLESGLYGNMKEERSMNGNPIQKYRELSFRRFLTIWRGAQNRWATPPRPKLFR